MNWPHPDVLKDLLVTEEGTTIVFSAPEGTKCSEWLKSYDKDDASREEFKQAIMKAIKSYTEDIERGTAQAT